MRKKLFTLLLAIVASIGTLFAESYNYYDFMYNGICYDIVNDSQVVVATGKYSEREWGSLVYYNRYENTTSMVIPEKVYNYNVIGIKYQALSGCYKLKSVTIANSIKNIGQSAFYNSYNLTSVTIGNGVTHIEKDAFSSCSKLKDIYINDLAAWCGISFENLYSNPLSIASNLYLNSQLVAGELLIPDSVTSIGDYAFKGCTGLTSVTIPSSVTSIGEGAFSGCSGLTSVTIGNSVTSIGNYAFENCRGLTSVTIPNSVTSIGSMAFRGCSGLTSMAIPSSVISIGDYAFSSCSGLTSIVWNAKRCADFTSTSTPFYYSRTKITSFIFGNEVEYIPAYLCYNMINAEVVVPNCNVEIGEDAFANCKLVKMNKLPDFSVTAKHEYDTPNSGSISINNPYNYEGTYFYTLNGSENASLKNMTAGEYRLVFYGEVCGDSIVKNINIYQYGMKVNGMYYLLDENNHTATLTYRGASYDDYSSEYSGNITIPKTITFDNKEYQVTGINSSTFNGCNNISSITMESETPISMYSSGLSSNCIIYVPYGSLNAYKSASGWRDYTIHVINPSHASTTTAATSAKITLGNTDEAKHISSCGMDGGEEEFAGNIIEYIGLEPNSEYANIPLFIKTIEGDVDNTTVSFTTTALELTTKASKPVSATTAILLAETNMADAEVSCGFEYKRNDAPDDMAGTKVFCPVASGQMAGRLKNLKDDVYYKYRAFYQSAAGNMYYGDWQYIFTGDVAVEFDPILYTYGATVVRENEATISGYALAGSEDFTEQGFEYWAETRANGGANAPRRMPAALGEHFFVQASGISLRVTLNNLDAGTVYKYRVYGKVGDQYYYGSEQAFTTTGTYTPPTYTITFANWDGTELQTSQVEEGTLPEYTGATPERPEDERYTYSFNGWTPTIVIASADATYTATYTATPKSQGIEEVPSDQVPCTKVLRDGQIFILRGEKVYNAQGALVK